MLIHVPTCVLVGLWIIRCTCISWCVSQATQDVNLLILSAEVAGDLKGGQVPELL